MLTGLSGGQILATCGGMTPGSVAEKSLSAGGSERYHDKEAGIGAKVPILMLGCLTRWLQIASEICLLVRRRASH